MAFASGSWRLQMYAPRNGTPSRGRGGGCDGAARLDRAGAPRDLAAAGPSESGRSGWGYADAAPTGWAFAHQSAPPPSHPVIPRVLVGRLRTKMFYRELGHPVKRAKANHTPASSSWAGGGGSARSQWPASGGKEEWLSEASLARSGLGDAGDRGEEDRCCDACGHHGHFAVNCEAVDDARGCHWRIGLAPRFFDLGRGELVFFRRFPVFFEQNPTLNRKKSFRCAKGRAFFFFRAEKSFF